MYLQPLSLLNTLLLKPPSLIFKYTILLPISKTAYILSLPFYHLLLSLYSLFAYLVDFTKSLEVSLPPHCAAYTHRCIEPSENSSCEKALFIYLSLAALVGLVTGTFLHFTSQSVFAVLHIAREHDALDAPQRTLASYRRERERRKVEGAGRVGQGQMAGWPERAEGVTDRDGADWTADFVKVGDGNGPGMRETILEEGSSDDLADL